MSTTLTHPSTPFASAFLRFLWKEYRMLRGLWLAVAAMAVLIQFTFIWLMPRSADLPGALFGTALGVAVLYAVGAAATSLSVEHEEETHGFLLSLPTDWRPIFAGKLLIATLSAILLAAVLTLISASIGAFDPRTLRAVFFVFGVAIVEALAWGTLFSLLVKRPLVAAILTLVLGGFAVHVIVNIATHEAVASTNPRAYEEATLMRLAFAAAVLACSIPLARRWLTITTPTMPGPALPTVHRFVATVKAAGRRIPLIDSRAERGQRRRLLARLLWQSWRESWKLLLLPLAIAMPLYFGLSAVAYFVPGGIDFSMIIGISTLLFVPALYGALAFSADQRRRGYRFLAEHAARPRYVWLSRHAVWLGALLAVLITFQLVVAVTASTTFLNTAERSLRQTLRWGYQDFATASELAAFQIQTASWGIRGAGLAFFGALAAYALGQLCSMVVRSEIMAAFIALVLSTVLSAWVATLFVWQLSGWIFLLPLAIGLLACTWLRAPDWLAERNTWPAWLKPAIAFVAPLILVALLLPPVRLSQVPLVATDYYGSIEDGKRRPLSVEEAIDMQLSGYRRGDTPEARETAEMYIRAAELLAAGPSENHLERWENPGRLWTHGGFLEKTIPANEMEEFRAAERKQLALQNEMLQEAIDIAIKASQRPACRFHFDAQMIAPKSDFAAQRSYSLIRGPSISAIEPYPLYDKLNSLRYWMIFKEGGKQHSSIDRYIAALGMTAHLRSGQPSFIFIDQLRHEQSVLYWLGNWALLKGRTKEELKEARDRLIVEFRLQPSLRGALLADHLIVRDVLEGKLAPLAFATRSDSLFVQLAYMANEFTWERERALLALDRITLFNLSQADAFTNYILEESGHNVGAAYLHQWLRPRNEWDPSPAMWEIAEPDAATSYLTRFEYQARTRLNDLFLAYANAEVCRRAALLQLALAEYRLDHGHYPPQLADLVPEYLDRLPLDPYSRQPFQYEPAGLDLPLSHWNQPEIKPHTPLLWSVGPGNHRLLIDRIRRIDETADDTDEDPPTIVYQVYRIRSDDYRWWNEPVFVFPLAK